MKKARKQFFLALLVVVFWNASVKADWNISVLPTALPVFRQYRGWEGMANVVLFKTIDKLKF